MGPIQKVLIQNLLLSMNCNTLSFKVFVQNGPAWGHQRVGGFALVEGLSPEIAILTVSGESLFGRPPCRPGTGGRVFTG